MLEAHIRDGRRGRQVPVRAPPVRRLGRRGALLVTRHTAASGEGVLWRLLAHAAATGEKPSAEAVRAAVEADPGAAARPFATPAGWKPVEGALVRLRPGLGEKNGLRAGELATVVTGRR